MEMHIRHLVFIIVLRVHILRTLLIVFIANLAHILQTVGEN